MADAHDLSLAALWEPVCRRDPGSGRVTCYLRRTHNLIRSARQATFRQCVGDRLRGHRHRGHGAAEDERLTRADLTAAARGCARSL